MAEKISSFLNELKILFHTVYSGNGFPSLICAFLIVQDLKQKTKRTPKKAQAAHYEIKSLLSLFYVGRLLLSLGIDRTCDLYTQWDSTGKTSFFLCEWLPFRESFLDRGHMSTSLVSSGT